MCLRHPAKVGRATLPCKSLCDAGVQSPAGHCGEILGGRVTDRGFPAVQPRLLLSWFRDVQHQQCFLAGDNSKSVIIQPLDIRSILRQIRYPRLFEHDAFERADTSARRSFYDRDLKFRVLGVQFDIKTALRVTVRRDALKKMTTKKKTVLMIAKMRTEIAAPKASQCQSFTATSVQLDHLAAQPAINGSEFSSCTPKSLGVFGDHGGVAG